MVMTATMKASSPFPGSAPHKQTEPWPSDVNGACTRLKLYLPLL